MKNILGIAGLLCLQTVTAQFKITLQVPSSFGAKELFLYTLNGSKDNLSSKDQRKGDRWQIKVDEPYIGMMKVYFPETNTSVNFIAENKDVNMRIDEVSGKVIDVQYLDESNHVMSTILDMQQKRELILPALYQMKEYYKEGKDFGVSLDKEIERLSQGQGDFSNYPFINFYQTNYTKFFEKKATTAPVTHEAIIKFLVNSGDMLETSSLMRPVLVSYVNIGPSTNVINDVDKLIAAVNTETPRGQIVLSELIEIFDAYNMKELKDKYLTQAQDLRCTINDRLSKTIASNNNTEIGSLFPNNVFQNVINTKAKSIYEVKAKTKVILFWSSTCSHCEAELPKLMEKYNSMKNQNIEIIALSLDADKVAYEAKVKDFPWINDSELKGWYSSYADTYNVHATPTYFVLDSANKIIAKPDHASDLISYLKLN
jgi:thioredoxin-related protein